MAHLYLPYRRPKNVQIMQHTSFILLTSAFFHWKFRNFCYMGKYRSKLYLNTYFSFFYCYWVFKGFSNQHDCKSDDISKLATPGLLKAEVYWKLRIISAHDVINKISSLGSNSIEVVLMWPKCATSSIYITEVIITATLQGLDQENRFFWEVVLVQV